MMEDKISVIVATYNQEDTIARTLDSILMQRCHLPIEIVVGEDCSTDSTRTVCESYAQRCPHIVRLMPKAPNKGMIRNYYDCLMACRGKYIADCAGDDFWTDPEKLEKELRIMEEHPTVTLVHTNWRFYNEDTHNTKDNTYVPFPALITKGTDILEAVITQTTAPVVHTCTSLYRADVIKRCYDEDPELFRNPDNGCEDLQLVCMLAANGDVAYLPDHTLNYSVGRPSVSFQPDDRRQFRFVSRTASLSFRLAGMFGINTPITRKFFADKAFALLMHAFRSHDKLLRDEACALMKTWGVKPDIKTRAALTIMSGSPLWNILLATRKVFVALKRI